ncbi:hypothetical protein MMP66_03330 [Acinetobacter dispersus]|uniref:tRNA 2-thiouridine synthesizing protein C n=1 Tax=Acinetobacter dispersus TaxID=70348 RepID=N9MNG3_9GAMM|nr:MULTISPECIES: hypothetical protein [Acinetobacter]ENW92286.1 hypothetical protein F904_02224 [Acinetobacter dispersus]ENX51556.1 hypothetical protein F901_02744 [Acinetobacter dispersus]MCH7389764.1 hypothetical protein [Acinetobacter dispersus]MCH7393309.1 hypothetical protein [Acinetobacter dispersus]QHH97153.1 hypothetical protein FPL17_06155 [Acinetobacter dispersus]
MKSVLVILTQPNLTSLQVNESLSATMVLATFGISVKVLLKSAALSLLNNNLEFDQFKHEFKIAANMVESFEFYDLTPILIESKNQELSIVKNTDQDIEFIDMNPEFIQSFDHILYW